MGNSFPNPHSKYSTFFKIKIKSSSHTVPKMERCGSAVVQILKKNIPQCFTPRKTGENRSRAPLGPASRCRTLAGFP